MKFLKLYSLIMLSTLLFCCTSANAAINTNNTKTANAVAIFAGGCFWCMQPPFDKIPGVISTAAGYTGGYTKNPSYKQVTQGNTGHYEAIIVYYDPKQVSYQALLKTFWHNIDPTDNGGQFCDRGNSYRPAIFYTNKQQKQLAVASKNKLIQSKQLKQVVVPIIAASTFYPAEQYHQYYYKKEPLRYKFYRYRCGRDARLKSLWQH